MVGENVGISVGAVVGAAVGASVATPLEIKQNVIHTNATNFDSPLTLTTITPTLS